MADVPTTATLNWLTASPRYIVVDVILFLKYVVRENGDSERIRVQYFDVFTRFQPFPPSLPYVEAVGSEMRLSACVATWVRMYLLRVFAWTVGRILLIFGIWGFTHHGSMTVEYEHSKLTKF
jgi:hypothetical protein